MNNEKCKYCDYVSKCSRLCEYGSYLCCLNRSFPKVVDKSYEELQKEVEKLQHYKTLYQSLKRQKDEAIEYIKLYISKEMVESTPGNNYELKELHLSDYKLSELLKILEGVNDE